MRKRPETLLKKLQRHVENRDRIVISSITYAEPRFGAIGKKASPKHNIIVNEFLSGVMDGEIATYWKQCNWTGQI